MADPYIGEIRIFCGNFAPVGWSMCNGSLLPISNYAALFTLIGTTYGGDGQTSFALPNLQSRVPVHQGPGFVMGQMAGEENHTLTGNEVPQHIHGVAALNAADSLGPAAAVYGGGTTAGFTATPPTPAVTMNPAMVVPNPGGQPHSNIMPYLAVNFIIALEGIFPSQN